MVLNSMAVGFGRRARSTEYSRLSEKFFHQVAFDISEPVVASFEAVGQLRVVDAQTIKHGGMKVVYMNGILDDVIGKIIRFAQGQATLNATPGHPDAETARMMIAAETGLRDFSLAVSGAAEFSGPNN